MWRRDSDGPSLLHIDKTKCHETMGEPTLAELRLNKVLGRFEVTRMGYDILQENDA